MDELGMKIGKKLKEFRERHGYTMRDVEEKTEINYSYVGKIEKGKIPSLDVLEKLCNLYKIDISTLFGDGVEIPPELKEIGVEWIAVIDDVKKEKLTPDEIRKAIEFYKAFQKLK